MFLGEKAPFKLRKFAAFDPGAQAAFSRQGRIRLVNSVLGGKPAGARLEYFQLFGKSMGVRLRVMAQHDLMKGRGVRAPEFSSLSLTSFPPFHRPRSLPLLSVQPPTSARACAPAHAPSLSQRRPAFRRLAYKQGPHRGASLRGRRSRPESAACNGAGAEREGHRRPPPHSEPANAGSAEGASLLPLGAPENRGGLQQPSIEEQDNSAKASNEAGNDKKAGPSKEGAGAGQKKPSNEAQEEASTRSENEKPALGGNICDPAVAFSPLEAEAGAAFLCMGAPKRASLAGAEQQGMLTN